MSMMMLMLPMMCGWGGGGRADDDDVCHVDDVVDVAGDSRFFPYI